MSAGAQLVPYDLISVMASRDVEADLHAVETGRLQALTPELQRYSDWLRALAEHRWQETAKPIAFELLQATDPAVLRRIIEADPIVLSDEFDVLFGRIAEAAEDGGEPQAAEIARARRLLLRDCRRYGLDQVLPAERRPDDGDGAQVQPDVLTINSGAGAALAALAGYAAPGRTEPVSGQELRDLLSRAILEMPPEEATLQLEFGPGELISLRDLFELSLGSELAEHPRDGTDVQEALRHLERLRGLRETAPQAWAKAEHNAALARATLARPGDLAALDEARAGFERALTIRTREASPDDWAVSLVALTSLLISDYPSHLPQYLEEAMRLLENALGEPPAGLSQAVHTQLALIHTGGQLRRADRRNDEQELGRATAALEGLVSETRDSGDSASILATLTNLGYALSLRAERTGLSQDWRRAAAVLRDGLDASSTAAPKQWVAAASNLGAALLNAGDIEAAIDILRAAIDRCAAADLWQEWAGTQSNLGVALLNRTDGDRDENVDAAIAAFEQARRVWTKDAFPTDWALTTARLATAYEAKPGADDRAAELLRQAAEAVKRDERPVSWARLTSRLANQLQPATAIERLDAAAEVLTRADYPHEWASIQHNRAGAFRKLAADGDPADANLAKAVDSLRAAQAARPADEAPIEWAQSTTLLGLTLCQQGELDEGTAQLRHALDVLRGGASATDMLHTASEYALALAYLHRWRESAAAFQDAIAAADRLFAASILRASREQQLSQSSWLSIGAAYVLAQDGRLTDAVAALEHGRTRLLAEALARDPDQFAGLSQSHPEQYQTYLAAVRRLTAAEAASTRLLTWDPAVGDTYRRRAEQAVREEIRQATAGYAVARDALPKPSAEPLKEPGGHATVYLFSTEWDTTGLLIGPDGVERIDLPGFDANQLRRFVHGDDERPGLLRAQIGSRETLAAELQECLATVGREVMATVADAIRRSSADAVTLVPVGPFSAIPLHAAPYGDGRCLLDEATVSYAPSRSVLARARRSIAARTLGRRSGLAVVDPTAGLAFAEYEAETMVRWTGGRRVDGRNVTTLDVLDEASHIHFVCHGQSVVDQPLLSYLALGEGRRLALIDLLTKEREDLLRNARFVVASACQTATVDVSRTPEEFIGLAAGFLAAGVPCFIGTLWPAEDVPSALLMTRFYELHFGDGRRADEALCQAQAWLRDLDGNEFLAYLEDRPRLAAVAGRQARFAARYTHRKFYRDPSVWSPYVLIGAADSPPPPSREGVVM